MKVYKDAFYINNQVLARALEDGYFDTFDYDHFKVVRDDYKFGRPLNNFTKNLKINNLIYDSYTHEYLGEYLRFLRDYKGMDLMPMYNCFSNREITSLKIEDTLGNEIFSTDTSSRVYMIKVDPFKEYTIYTNNGLEVVTGYYDNGIIDIFKDVSTIEASIKFPFEKTYQNFGFISFDKPLVYRKLNKEHIEKYWTGFINNTAYNQRKNLHLFIKVPAAEPSSSIVILEGDYSNYNIKNFDGQNVKLLDHIISKDYKERRTSDLPTNPTGVYTKPVREGEDGLKVEQVLYGEVIDGNLSIDSSIKAFLPISNYEFDQGFDREYYTKLWLTKMNTGINYPFSPRLLEYLTGYAITPIDEIDNNILRVQNKLLRDGRLYNKKLSGVWTKDLRNVVYGVARTSGVLDSKYDVFGYVDKDLEKEIVLEDGE